MCSPMETPFFTGRAVAALAADEGIMKKTGKVDGLGCRGWVGVCALRRRLGPRFCLFAVFLLSLAVFLRSLLF